jgi:hypothetical protein
VKGLDRGNRNAIDIGSPQNKVYCEGQMTGDEAAALREKAREWQAEADIGIDSMRSPYPRMADPYSRLADAIDPFMQPLRQSTNE